jgi:Xaa-Pro aminopeptidase
VSQIHINRIDRLRTKLTTEGFLVASPIDLYYFTGLELSAGKLLISAKDALLLVDGRYIETAQGQSPVQVALDGQKAFLDAIAPWKSIGVDSEKTTVQSWQDLNRLAERKFLPIQGLISRLRAIKGPEEIHLLEKAAALGSKGFDFVVGRLNEGVQESALAFELEMFWRKQGAKGVAFEPIIAFGANSSKPHYRAGDRSLARDEPVLIDIGVELNHYHSDMTRMAVLGSLPEQMKAIFDIVQEAHRRAIELVKPGTSIAALDDAARLYIESKGYGKNFSHSLGHGIGLEVHEFPTIRRNPSNETLFLEEGMAITIEPGIYLPGIGGVRLEDTVIVTENGHKNITDRSICCHFAKKSS